METKEEEVNQIEENINKEIEEEQLKEKQLTKEEVQPDQELEKDILKEESNKSKETVLKTPDLQTNESLKLEIILKEESETADNICNILVDIVERYPDDKYSSKFPKYIKCKMEEQFGRSWNVFVGEHFCGVCSYEEDTLVQVKIGFMMILVFKTYIFKEE